MTKAPGNCANSSLRPTALARLHRAARTVAIAHETGQAKATLHPGYGETSATEACPPSAMSRTPLPEVATERVLFVRPKDRRYEKAIRQASRRVVRNLSGNACRPMSVLCWSVFTPTPYMTDRRGPAESQDLMVRCPLGCSIHLLVARHPR